MPDAAPYGLHMQFQYEEGVQSGMFQAPAGYDEETISRALRAMPPQQHHNAPAESAHTQSQNPYPPSMQQHMSAIHPVQLPPVTNPQ